MGPSKGAEWHGPTLHCVFWLEAVSDAFSEWTSVFSMVELGGVHVPGPCTPLGMPFQTPSMAQVAPSQHLGPPTCRVGRARACPFEPLLI